MLLSRCLAVPILAIILGFSGCSELSYYWQAGMGQLEIINKRRPIDEVLTDDTITDEVKRRLRLILKAQDFATRVLALPEEGHYRFYTDLGRKYVSWLVVAAPPLSFQEHQFCYLIVGCLGYRGFFDPADARVLAEELREDGLDVLVRPVKAYSTLGWFDDPVLNTFLDGDDLALVGTIFHEQSHRRFFLEGETAFNESFAEFVEEEGVRRFLTESGEDGEEAMRRFIKRRADRRRFRAIISEGRKRLENLYSSSQTKAEKLAKKPELFEALRQDYQNQRRSFKILQYDAWFAQPLNNANLVGVGHYSLHVDAFRALFISVGSDFERFYRAVEKLGEMTPEIRRARLRELEIKIARLTQHSQ